MLRRLYYLLPDYNQAKRVVDELLLHHVHIEHIHFMARSDKETSGLPMATLFQRSDLRHSLVIGLMIGAVLGVILALVAHKILDIPYGGFMVLLPIVGAILSVWFSTMVGMMTPNSELKPFMSAIEDGSYLLIVDVPQHNAKDIDQLIKNSHPEAISEGPEPTYPSFP